MSRINAESLSPSTDESISANAQTRSTSDHERFQSSIEDFGETVYLPTSPILAFTPNPCQHPCGNLTDNLNPPPACGGIEGGAQIQSNNS